MDPLLLASASTTPVCSAGTSSLGCGPTLCVGSLLPLLPLLIHFPHDYKSKKVTSLFNHTLTWHPLALRGKCPLLCLVFSGLPALALVSVFDLIF